MKKCSKNQESLRQEEKVLKQCAKSYEKDPEVEKTKQSVLNAD